MLERSKLLVDIGNTRTKFVSIPINNNVTKLPEQQYVKTIDELRPHIANTSSLWVSSVANATTANNLRSLASQYNKPIVFAKTHAKAHGLENAYTNIDNMGVDRWLAMIAVRALSSSDIIVIDIGTAMTCDFIMGNKHIGGWIAPGLSLAQQVLVENTENVFSRDTVNEKITFGTDTAECVLQGCTSQIIGCVMMAVQMMKKRTANFDLFITGGNKYLIPDGIHEKTFFNENLVLEGLLRISEQKSFICNSNNSQLKKI